MKNSFDDLAWCEVYLTQGKVAIVDAKDFPRVARYRWTAAKNRNKWYAQRSVPKPGGGQKTEKMHSFILGTKERIDHWDGDGLNNRRRNLRPCTNSQNHANRDKQVGKYTSKYKGVTRDHNSWKAQIMVEGKLIYLGSFQKELDAARAYNEFEKRLLTMTSEELLRTEREKAVREAWGKLFESQYLPGEASSAMDDIIKSMFPPPNAQ